MCACVCVCVCVCVCACVCVCVCVCVCTHTHCVCVCVCVCMIPTTNTVNHSQKKTLSSIKKRICSRENKTRAFEPEERHL
jgi:hypothetical protein